MSALIMGIVNLTDNSFVETSRMGDAPLDEIVSYSGKLLREGADIIDIGACSTAPGNDIVPEAVELERLRRVLPVVFETFPYSVFSIDTFRCSVAREALRAAQRFLKDPQEQLIINDISSGGIDPSMLSFIAGNRLRYIAMDSSAEPYAFFSGFCAAAASLGVERWILDPGFGFGKTLEQNWDILRNIGRLKDFGRPILAALSRKRMIWQKYGLSPSSCAEQSVMAEKMAISCGADIIRTHDVAAHRQ